MYCTVLHCTVPYCTVSTPFHPTSVRNRIWRKLATYLRQHSRFQSSSRETLMHVGSPPVPNSEGGRCTHCIKCEIHQRYLMHRAALMRLARDVTVHRISKPPPMQHSSLAQGYAEEVERLLPIRERDWSGAYATAASSCGGAGIPPLHGNHGPLRNQEHAEHSHCLAQILGTREWESLAIALQLRAAARGKHIKRWLRSANHCRKVMLSFDTWIVD